MKRKQTKEKMPDIFSVFRNGDLIRTGPDVTKVGIDLVISLARFMQLERMLVALANPQVDFWNFFLELRQVVQGIQ